MAAFFIRPVARIPPNIAKNILGPRQLNPISLVVDEAIVTAIKENPKLILLDLTLPDMTGTAGMVGYVQKPVPLKEIEAVIEQFILLER